MTTTTEAFIEWLKTLPPGEIEIAGTLTGGMICTAKRVVCARGKTDGKLCLIVNPMGSHFTDEFWNQDSGMWIFDT